MRSREEQFDSEMAINKKARCQVKVKVQLLRTNKATVDACAKRGKDATAANIPHQSLQD